jgi:hypothetical protein
MAQKILLVDDLDASEAAETIVYAVDGQQYEIDLSDKNAERFRSLLKEFVDASRPVQRGSATAPTPAPRTTRRRQGASQDHRDDIAQIRAWAEEQGLEVSARGRIKKDVVDAYDKAHK